MVAAGITGTVLHSGNHRDSQYEHTGDSDANTTSHIEQAYNMKSPLSLET